LPTQIKIYFKLSTQKEKTMTTNKTTARLVGALFLITTATYITGNALLESLLGTPDFLATLSATRVSLGALLMFINCAGVVGIGVLMFPLLKQHSETVAVAYVATRIIEFILLSVGVISFLSLIPLSQEYIKAGTADPSCFQTLGALAIKGNFFAYQLAMIVLGMGSLMFCYLLYQSKLIPRFMASWGLIGYAALLMGALLELFGFKVGLLYSVPGGLFELALAFWLFVKGFHSPATVSVAPKVATNKV
jgi:hypothetical protein